MSPRPSLDPDHAWLASLTVLCVEDEPEAREEMGLFLRRRVGKLLEAPDGVAGLQLFRQMRPAIVVTDIQMPRMNGLSFAEEVRKEDAKVPLVVVSAFEAVEYLRRSIEAGITNYLTKPVDVAKLDAALLAAARRSRLRTMEARERQSWKERVRAMQTLLDARAGRDSASPPARKASLTSTAVLELLETTFDRQTTIDVVARGLALSERTLRRKLDQEGTSFKKLFDAVREARARRMLATETLSIPEVAELLGFQGASSFGQAFKRWTGMSPGQFRTNAMQKA